MRKGVYDVPMKITISSQKGSYNLTRDTFDTSVVAVTRFAKNGYLFFDESGENVGIVFMSDDARRARYGNAELLFFKKFESKYGSWRIIKQDGEYLSYEQLEKILAQTDKFSILIDGRTRPAH